MGEAASVRLVVTVGEERSPAWSPDGKPLALVRSMGGGSGETWLVRADGGEKRRLTRDAAGVFSDGPVFTPDGRGVVHQSNRGGGAPIRIASGACHVAAGRRGRSRPNGAATPAHSR